VIFEISAMIEVVNMTGTAASPIVLFLPAGIQSSAREGTVMIFLEMRAPAIKTMPEGKASTTLSSGY
jgi:hypothetical protein